MKNGHKVKIQSPLAMYGAVVWIDNKKLMDVSGIEFSHIAGCLPVVTVTFIANCVEIDGVMQLKKLSKDIYALPQVEFAGFIERTHDGSFALTENGWKALLNAVPEEQDLT